MEFWYLWVVFAVLCVATVFVILKASKALRGHNEETKRTYAQIERLTALKADFRGASAEKVRGEDAAHVLDGAFAVLQAKLENDADPDRCFAEMNEPQQNIYTLYWLVQDVQTSLSFFFKNNGEPLRAFCPRALHAVGANTLGKAAEGMYAMFDETNEEASLEPAKLDTLDAAFAKALDRSALLVRVQSYAAEHAEKIFGAA